MLFGLDVIYERPLNFREKKINFCNAMKKLRKLAASILSLLDILTFQKKVKRNAKYCAKYSTLITI